MSPPRGRRDGGLDEIELSTIDALPPPLSPDGAIVSVLSGKAKGQWRRVPGTPGASLSIGKARDNDLVLPDETVSRRHLVIRRLESGIEISDAGSTNGVFIGTTRLQQASVEPGTIITAGGIELLIAVELDNVALPPSADDHFGYAVGATLAMRRIFGVLERIAPTNATVLLTGETGTGKDAIARSIHTKSKRADGPFEVVDCGAVTGSIIESELFGHERGAFTGAVSSRAGAFERAAGGTIFLDELGELAVELQPKLLRILEAREFRRVGGSKTYTADVRVIAATTRDLTRQVRDGTFREDLFFRLAVVSIHVPPLRDRLDDLPLLVQRLLTAEREPRSLAPDAAMLLRRHDWPGNVRELRNVLERGRLLSEAGDSIQLTGFTPRARAEDDDDAPLAFDETLTYRESRARFETSFERRYLRWLLEKHRGNISAAARAVKMDRNHLADLARRHGLDRRR